MNFPDDGRAERLAPWIRALPLNQQSLITGTTLILEEINGRRGESLPHTVDVVALRETTDPREAAHLAREISAQYARLEPLAGPDCVDEHWRISNMTKIVAERIDQNYPASDGGR